MSTESLTSSRAVTFAVPERVRFTSFSMRESFTIRVLLLTSSSATMYKVPTVMDPLLVRSPARRVMLEPPRSFTVPELTIFPESILTAVKFKLSTALLMRFPLARMMLLAERVPALLFKDPLPENSMELTVIFPELVRKAASWNVIMVSVLERVPVLTREPLPVIVMTTALVILPELKREPLSVIVISVTRIVPDERLFKVAPVRDIKPLVNDE